MKKRQFTAEQIVSILKQAESGPTDAKPVQCAAQIRLVGKAARRRLASIAAATGAGTGSASNWRHQGQEKPDKI
ncbi:MAG: hypothetical protein OXC81_00995 [Betaproteobacteria bacterium]|nr:hypothetical protein [Betaproteobacteria bacterium]